MKKFKDWSLQIPVSWIVGGFGLGLLSAGLCLKWIDFPLTEDRTAFELFFNTAPGPLANISIGFLGSLLLVFWSLAVLIGKHYSLATMVASVQIILAFQLVGYCTFKDPILSTELNKEHMQLIKLLQIEKTADFPSGERVKLAKFILPETRMLQRASYGIYYMGTGWWFWLGGAVLLSATTLFMIPKPRSRMLVGFGAIICICLSSLALVANSLRAEFTIRAAERASIEGLSQKAIELYDKAMRLDVPLLLNSDLRLAIGYQCRIQLDCERAERQLLEMYEMLPVDVHYAKELARQIPEPVVRQIAYDLLVDAYTVLMEKNYRKGNFLVVMDLCHQTLSISPNHPVARSFLSLSCYKTGEYESALQLSRDLLNEIHERMSRAFIFANMADAYEKMGDKQAARDYYEKSEKEYPEHNIRALRNLAGL